MIHIYIRFPPSDLPMVVPPLPWLSPVINKSSNNFLTNNFDQDTGGFLTKKTRLVRIPESSFTDHDQLLEDLPQVTDQSELSIHIIDQSQGGLNPIIDSLNQLGSVAWRVNTQVLDLACQLFVHPNYDPGNN